jgi:hypothetical protein
MGVRLKPDATPDAAPGTSEAEAGMGSASANVATAAATARGTTPAGLCERGAVMMACLDEFAVIGILHPHETATTLPSNALDFRPVSCDFGPAAPESSLDELNGVPIS